MKKFKMTQIFISNIISGIKVHLTKNNFPRIDLKILIWIHKFLKIIQKIIKIYQNQKLLTLKKNQINKKIRRMMIIKINFKTISNKIILIYSISLLQISKKTLIFQPWMTITKMMIFSIKILIDYKIRIDTKKKINKQISKVTIMILFHF